MSFNKLKCPRCSSQFEHDGPTKPLILPCGDTICKNCIKHLEKNRSVTCPSCSSFHFKEEFPVNRLILDLVDLQNSRMNIENSSGSLVNLDESMDECGECKQPCPNLEHCSHCGKAICQKCRSLHKVDVLEKLHTCRAFMSQGLEIVAGNNSKREALIDKLQSSCEEEIQRIRKMFEKIKLMALDELEKRRDKLINEVQHYADVAKETLEAQKSESKALHEDIKDVLEKSDVVIDNKSLSNYDLLDLCQTQIKYTRGVKQLERLNRVQAIPDYAIPIFSDEGDFKNFFNSLCNYGQLENKGTFKMDSLQTLSKQNHKSPQLHILHKYKTITSGSPISTFSYRSQSKDAKVCKNELLCILHDGSIAISSSENQCVSIYNKSSFEHLKSLHVDQFNSLKALDSNTKHLVLLVRNSLEIYSLDSFKSIGRFLGNNELILPVALTVTDVRIFVYDQDKERSLHFICIFDGQGRYIQKKFICDKSFDPSISVSLGKSMTNDQVIMIGSSKHNFLKIYDMNIEKVRELNTDVPSIQGRKWRPHQVCSDNEGNILVLDSGGRKVIVFNADGEYSNQFDPFSTKTGQSSQIRVNSDGNVLLLDTVTAKCLIF